MSEELEFRYSSTDTFLECRRKYDYQYVQNLQKKPYAGKAEHASAAETGTIGHAGLAQFYKGGDLDDALQAVEEEAIKLHLFETPEHVIVRSLVRQYASWRLAEDMGYTNVMVEERIRAEIVPGVFITGQMDVLREDDFALLNIMDHKFVASAARTSNAIDINRQLYTYAWLVQMFLKREVHTATLNMIQRKPLKKNNGALIVERATIYIDQETLKKHVAYLTQTVHEMLDLKARKITHPELVIPHPGQHCSWCPYTEPCFLKDEDPAAEASILEENFELRVEDLWL